MATSGRRAFAQKLNKNLQAADIRRQISGQTTPSSISRASSISNVSVIHPQMASLSEIVDPPDFEAYLEKHHYRIQSDDCPHLLKFPDDDIEVTTSERTCRTVKPALPDEEQLVTDLQVRDCIKLYTSEWALVSRKYKDKVTGHEKKKLKKIQDELIEKNDNMFEVDELELIDEDELQELEIRRGSIHMERTPRGSWASNIFNLESTEADDLLPKLLDHAPIDQQDSTNTDNRNKDRKLDLFTLYPAMDEEDAIERRSSVVVPAEHFGSRLLIKCLQLKLELEIEPLFATMALYDSKEKKKVSENFYFDMNSDAIKGMINKSSYPDVSTMARGAVFSLTYPSTDVYIVIKLEKVLQQGDIQECADPYMKESESQNQKVLEKVKANAKYFCEKLGAYRMPFAWTAIDLMHVINGSQGLGKSDNGESTKTSASSLLKRQSFNLGLLDTFSRTNSLDDQARKKGLAGLTSHGSLPRKGNDSTGGSLKRSSSDRRSFYRGDDETGTISAFKPVTLTVSSFFKQEGDKLSDDDLFKFLADLKRPTSILKRLKCIPGSLKLDISKHQEPSSYCLTPDLYQVSPYPDMRTRPTREMQEFPSRDVYVPNNVYRNIMYIYPLNLNFSGRAGSARNIAIKVQLLKGSGEDDSIPLQCIFGKSSSPEFVHEMYSSVTYHNKTPDFYEEIKIRLPPSLEDSNHLLFTFYHISCQKKQDNTQIETPIGYTWLPIYRNQRLQTGNFNLPVSVEKLPKAYSMLSPDTQLPYMKWVDGQKKIFEVSVKAVSSIHSQDDKLDQFLWLCHSIEAGVIPKSIPNDKMEYELNKSVKVISEARPEPLVQFLHLLLDKLFLMMVKSPVISGQLVTMSSNCFESLTNIVERIHSLLDKSKDNHERNTLLAAYIEHVFKPPEDVPRPAGLSPSGSYSSLKKSHSMNLKSPGQRNSYGGRSSMPQSPDDEVGGIMHTRVAPDRYGSAKVVQPNSETGMGNVPVRGLGGRSPPRKLVHEQLALQLGICSGRSKDQALKHAWFFFDIMIKSMAQYYYSDEIKLKDLPRRERFSDSFCSDIEAIVNMVGTEILARYSKEARAMSLLNIHLAFFIQDLFTLMDRGFVFKQIQGYFRSLADRLVTLTDPTPLAQIKLDFLRVVCSHEHYVTLNLPLCPSLITNPPSPTLSIISTTSFCSLSSYFTSGEMQSNAKSELSYEFKQRHFLTGLLLSDLSAMLLTNNNNNHRQAIDIIANLLASHDCDPRYIDIATRMRVASLYLPLLDIIMDAIPQFNCTNASPKLRPSFMFGIAEEDDDSGLGINKSVALAIAGTSVVTMAEDASVGSVQRQSSSTRMTEESTKDLLMCFMWVVKNVEASSLQQWWSGLGVQRFIQLLDVFYYCLCCFEYKGKTSIIKKLSRTSMKKTNDIKQRLEDAILGSASARSEFISRRSAMYSSFDRTASGPALGQSERVRWRKDLTHFRQTNEILESKSKAELEDDAVLEGCLSAEVSLSILDSLELIIQSIQSKENLSGVLSSVMQVLLHMLQCNQSVVVLKNALATQRSLVFKYPGLLFEDETEQCADLCLRILKHCSSCIDTVRSHASASLYLLMRQNFEIGNNFARVKMQVTMSLSHLVGTVTNFHEGYLRKSLKTILMYADEDADLRLTTFPEQVHNLVFNLHMILSDTVKMKEFKEDPEMLMDLMYRIAKGYQNSPDLRLTWLQNMAGMHMKQGNHVESAMCLIHCAGLVTEYLHMQEDRPYLPVGCVAFEKISSNVLEESAVSDDVVSPDEEGICSGKYFTESGLVGLLEQAATFFTEGGFYEVVNEVYKVLIPIHENNRNYNRLSTIHSKLCDAFHKIVELDKKRMFGTYFRVGYFGTKFGDLDGEEFIYKEPKITKLPEIAHRLQNFYEDRFGEENLVMMKDSRKVDVSTLDPLKSYIQVTYVEPYFESFEYDIRRTHFDKSYNLRRFVFATPFTQEGRAHGELHEQYKRKTILTTSHAFPYVKTRCTVIHKEEIVLRPIEVAIEDMQKKMLELAQATIQDPPDPKFLQMVLQGCIGTTVNQGPFEVAQVFLGDKAAAEIPLDKQHNKLRICFKEFSKRCSDALRKNKTLIASDQKEYQKELERNYHRFTDRLMPLIANRDPVATPYFCSVNDLQSIHV